jgi:hypothetical protein
MKYDQAGDRWTWLYDGESRNLKFSVAYSSIPPQKRPIILGSFYSRVDDQIYLDVGSVEQAIKAVGLFDRHIKRVVADIEYVTAQNQVCSRIEEHPKSCFDRIFSEIRAEIIELAVEERLAATAASIREGRVIEMMNAKHFDLVEAFPARYHEDGLPNLEALLMARQTVAVARLSGKEDYCMSDFVKDAAKRMSPRRSSLCLCGIGGQDQKREWHSTNPWSASAPTP